MARQVIFQWSSLRIITAQGGKLDPFQAFLVLNSSFLVALLCTSAHLLIVFSFILDHLVESFRCYCNDS